MPDGSRTLRVLRILLPVLSCLLLAACSGHERQPDAAMSSLSVDHSVLSADDEPVAATVVVKDATGRLLRDKSVEINVEDASGHRLYNLSVYSYTDALGQVQESLKLQVAGTYTISASVSGNTLVQHQTVQITAGAPAAIKVLGGDRTTQAGAVLLITAQLFDAHENSVTSPDRQVAVHIRNDGTAPIGGTTTRTSVASLVTFDDLVFSEAGDFTVVVSFSDPAPIHSAKLEVVVGAGPPATLAFSTQPEDADVGHDDVFVAVEGRDAFGNPINVPADLIDVTLVDPSGVLHDVHFPADGKTNHAGTITRAGTGYTLIATTPGYAAAVSVPFAIIAGPGHHLLFTQVPTDTPTQTRYVPDALTTITPAPAVKLVDAYGNLVDDSTRQVSVFSNSSTFLSGTTTRTLSHGAATFPDIECAYRGRDSLYVAAPALVTTDVVPMEFFPTVVVGGPAGRFSPQTLAIYTANTVWWYWAGDGAVISDGNDFCSPSDTSCASAPTLPAGTIYRHKFGPLGDYTYHSTDASAATITVQ